MATVLVAVNGQPVRFFDEFDSIKKSLVGMPISVTVIRDNNAPVT